MPKLHPMLFSTPMVQAILDGRKSQTRRIMKPQAQAVTTLKERNEATKGVKGNKLKFIRTYSGFDYAFPESPYLPGDVLWVREKWAPILNRNGERIGFYHSTDDVLGYFDERTMTWKWKPGIHMPFEAARLFLRIKSVKYERLQDILDAHVIAEGILKIDEEAFKYDDLPGSFASAQSAFRSLWRGINGIDSWELNPWVWVIEFERITKEEALKVKEASNA